MSKQFVQLSQLADVLGGFAFKSHDLGGAGYPVVKIANIEPPNVNCRGSERALPEVVVGLDRFKLKAGDIVMAMTGATTGKVGRIRSSETLYLNQRVAKLSAKAGPEYDDFIYAHCCPVNYSMISASYNLNIDPTCTFGKKITSNDFSITMITV